MLGIIVVVECVTVGATNIVNDNVMFQMLARIETLEKRGNVNVSKIVDVFTCLLTFQYRNSCQFFV